MNICSLPWYIEPLAYSILTPYSWNIKPPLVLSSELGNTVMEYWPLSHAILNPYPWYTAHRWFTWETAERPVVLILIFFLKLDKLLCPCCANWFFIICFCRIYLCWFSYTCCDFCAVSCTTNNRTFLFLTDKYFFLGCLYHSLWIRRRLLNTGILQTFSSLSLGSW